MTGLNLDLTKSETRKLRGDMIETFKIITGRDSLNRGNVFFYLDSNKKTRGHNLKLKKPMCRLHVRNINYF